MPRRNSSAGSSFSRNGADSNRGSRNNGWLNFESSAVGVGTSRLAFRCRVEDGCYRGYTEGSYLMFKVFKPEQRYRDMVVDYRDVDMQVTARNLAVEFNRQCRPTKHGYDCDVHVRDATLGCFDEDRQLFDEYGDSFWVDSGDEFLLEREIRGSFEKFNSNSGWSSGCVSSNSSSSCVPTEQSMLVWQVRPDPRSL